MDAPPHTTAALRWNFVGSMPAADIIAHGANVLVCLLALLAYASDAARAALYLSIHVGIASCLFALAAADRARAPRSRAFGFLHDWMPAVVLMLFFFEIDPLVSRVHPFDDYRYDRALQAVDVWLFGDPDALIARVASPWLSELLTLCYVAYYPLIIAVPAALYARGRLDDFRCVAAILTLGFAVTYLGYVLFPAIGPHWLSEVPRAPALGGYGLAGFAHALLRAVPSEPPDAFPSGHALVGMLAPALAYRWYRPLFRWVLPVGLGIVLATVYLRYHYVLDVVAAAVVACVAWKLGRALHARLGGVPTSPPPAAQTFRWRTQGPHDLRSGFAGRARADVLGLVRGMQSLGDTKDGST